MANQIHNCGMYIDEILAEEDDRSGKETAKAFDRMFDNPEEKLDKIFKEVWKNE